MAKPLLTYSPEPQEFFAGQWQLCPPAEAERWVVVRRSYPPRKRHQPRRPPAERAVAIFYGPEAEAQARACAAAYISKTNPRPKGVK